MLRSLILLSLVAIGDAFNITFVNNCQDSLSVWLKAPSQCVTQPEWALTPLQSVSSAFDQAGTYHFRSNCTGLTVASTYPDPFSPMQKYEIDVTAGFDQAMQIKPESSNGLTLTCKSVDCAGTYWFGEKKTVLFDATYRNTDFTLTFCPVLIIRLLCSASLFHSLTLLLLAFPVVTYAEVCFKPSVFTAKHETFQLASVQTQTECETLCEAEAQCTAIVTEQRPTVLWCVLLGAEIASVNCAPSIDVFSKSDC